MTEVTRERLSQGELQIPAKDYWGVVTLVANDHLLKQDAGVRGL